MQIKPISQFNTMNFRAIKRDVNQNDKQPKREFDSKHIGYCLAGLAVIGIASYAIYHGKFKGKNFKNKLNEHGINPESVIDPEPFVRPEVLVNPKPVIKPETLNETMTEIVSDDGTIRTFQKFYKNGKLYETYVYKSASKDIHEAENIVRYNFAYEDGKIAAVAKQNILNNGNQHGVYIDNGFDPFPIFMKSKGEKEYKKVEGIYTFEPLCEHDSRFNPENL